MSRRGGRVAAARILVWRPVTDSEVTPGGGARRAGRVERAHPLQE